MNIQDCLQLLREIKDVAFATVDEKGFPQVRIIDVMIVENEKLYFCTARGKDFYKQITSTGRVAITGLNKSWQTVRVMGKVVKLEEQKKWIDRIFDENVSMNNVYPGESRYILEAFCVYPKEIEFFDLGKEPINRERIVTEQVVLKEYGFMITDDCIGCGKCAINCPQQCVSKGMPYLIAQNHCLHCGLCYENCPVQAIERRQER